MFSTRTRRPRNVNAARAAAILYGDWGTSKAYVIGLAFAVAGYSSFWLVAAMCALVALVGLNYTTICKHYPNGGGVYASVRHRSEIISIVGAFLLIADYIVTAALSALSAFAYLGVPHPAKFAALSILTIGILNYFGPKHTGSLAVALAAPCVAIVALLCAFSLPHLGDAVAHLQPLEGGFWKNWNGFVAVVLALSGVEAVANTTGVMRLNPHSSYDHPSVTKTSTPAILIVMVEVCVATVLLSLATHALSGLQVVNGEVNAPEHPAVRDSMLRYLAECFIGQHFGNVAGQIAGWTVSITFGCLLLSAVNTAIVGLISVLFLMAGDQELPQVFGRPNFFGVPLMSLAVATLVPAAMVVTVSDVAGLAELYAVGVVGAIATNLGATSTDRKLALTVWERSLMFVTFLVMAVIEVTLLFDKPAARVFAASILAIGLVLRGLAKEHAERQKLATGPPPTPAPPSAAVTAPPDHPAPLLPELMENPPVLCAVRGIGRTLDYAIEEAQETKRPLYLLFVREQPILNPYDSTPNWRQDGEAREIFEYAKEKAATHPVVPCYTVSDSLPDTIVDVASTVGASRLIIGTPRRLGLTQLLRGNLMRQISRLLPENIDLLVHS